MNPHQDDEGQMPRSAGDEAVDLGLPAGSTHSQDEDEVTMEITDVPEFLPELDVDNAEVDGLPPAPQEGDEQETEAKDEPDLSVDGTASIPDDTPSVPGSSLSSPPRSMTSPARRGSPASPHRPFDRRFHSRMSSSSLLTPRAGSPAFLTPHSRHSSIGSTGLPTPSEQDDSAEPWEVVRWSKLRKLSGQAFSEVGKRNFGTPTCMAVTDTLVVGTSKGMVLVFDHQQTNKAVIGAGTRALECGPVTALAVSADHTTVAAGHASGNIFTWEISRPAKPFLHIPTIDVSLPQARRGDGHVDASAVVHVGFLGYRRTALVSADDKGMAFSHLATRGTGAIGRTVKTTRILGRYPEVVSRTTKPLKKSSVLAFSPLPLGNVEQKTDGLGLVAMLTPYLLVIVSTTPIAQTQHKAARPKEVAAHSAMTAALAWFPAIKLKGVETQTTRNKLAYAWSNVLTILEVHEVEQALDADKDKPPELQFLPRSRYSAEEAIVAVQWLSRSVIAALTITQQLLVIEDVTMHVTESFDLLPKNVYHADLFSQQLLAAIEDHDEEDTSMHGVVADAFHMSFRAYKGRLFLLGHSEVWWGSLTNWADRLLALMNIGDFIGAIRLATRYYSGQGEKLTIGLAEDNETRKDMVGEKLFEMLSASLKYAFGKNQQAHNEPVEKPQMIELAEASISACLMADDQDFLFETVFTWYDDHDLGNLFLDVLEPHILSGDVTSLPPPALKVLIEHFSVTHTPSKLEEIICLLDPTYMDIDQVTNLCKHYNLYDAYIYVWNQALTDFTSPLEDLLQMAADLTAVNGNAEHGMMRAQNAQKVFPYISFILTGRSYPTAIPLPEALAATAKAQIYDYFFTAIPRRSSTSVKRPGSEPNGVMPYDNLKRILAFDTPSFMSALNEAFEDTFLNSTEDASSNGHGAEAITTQKTTYNRQFIVLVMLEVMSGNFDAEDTIYLDMFVSRNLPKYPQYMLLSGTAMQDIFTRLCQYPDDGMREDCQLSLEYLLSVYHPSDPQALLPLLHKAKFYRILKAVYRQERQYVDTLSMFFLDEDNQEGAFAVILEFLAPQSEVPQQQRVQIESLLKEHAADLIRLDVQRAASTIETVVPKLHDHFLQATEDDDFGRFQYLDTLFELKDGAQRRQRGSDSTHLEAYIRLMCQFQPERVSDFVDTLQEGDLRLSEVIPSMERTGVIDAAVVLEARTGHVRDSMDRLIAHLSFLSSALHGLLSRQAPPDSSGLEQTIGEVMTSIDKYSRVGIWLCQGQSKGSQASRSTPKPLRRSSILRQPLLFDEGLWVELIDTVVGIAREVSADPQQRASRDGNDVTLTLRNVIQQVFTALLSATTINRDGSGSTTDLAFLRILRTFLANAARIAPSLSELRGVIGSIFAAYAHEQSLLSLSNAMLDKDVFVSLQDVHQRRRQGWRPRGQVCEICRRKVWGPGLGSEVLEAWQKNEQQRRTHRLCHRSEDDSDDSPQNKGKEAAEITSDENDEAETKSVDSGIGPIVAFSCRHLYHQKCLTLPENEEVAGAGAFSAGSEVSRLVCPACVANKV
jgi:vacuolar protein sorting-associated protein 8